MRHIGYLIIFLMVGGNTLAKADAAIGSITGQLNGQQREWSTVRIDGMASSATYDAFIPGFKSIHIQGHKNGAASIAESFSIDFTLRQNGSIDEPSLIFLPGSSLSEYYEAKDTKVSIELEKFEETGDGWEISGHATGQLLHTKREGIKFLVDETNVIKVDVTFATKLYTQE